jgi:hypothetical protein
VKELGELEVRDVSALLHEVELDALIAAAIAATDAATRKKLEILNDYARRQASRASHAA